jgi:predicted nucleic acid-binding protein
LREVVVDASVVVKWLLPEEHSDAALQLLGGRYELWAPDLIWAEVGNVLWKRWRKRELSEEEISSLSADFRRFPLSRHASEPLFEAAGQLARKYDRSFYDSLYLALAAHRGHPLITGDLRFYNALKSRVPDLLWVGDISDDQPS